VPGQKWDLTSGEVDFRRRVFWEVRQAIDLREFVAEISSDTHRGRAAEPDTGQATRWVMARNQSVS
jgi:hypothetical protein